MVYEVLDETEWLALPNVDAVMVTLAEQHCQPAGSNPAGTTFLLIGSPLYFSLEYFGLNKIQPY